MANIVNITRTYRFANGIPLVNDQLDSELSNIVDTFNKDLAAVTSNVVVSAGVSVDLIGSNEKVFPASGSTDDLTSITLGEGEWDVSALIGMYNNGATVTEWGAAISSSTTKPGYPPGSGSTGWGFEWFSAQAHVNPPTGTNFAYISIPPFVWNVSGSQGSSILSTTTLYIRFGGLFTVSTPKAFGSIRARRMSK